MRFTTCFFLLALWTSPLPAQESANYGALAIYGRWRGTSICVDKATDTACKDEKIVYNFDTANAKAGIILLHAYKYAGNTLDLMGDLPLQYTDSTHTWSTDFTGRLRIRWTYRINGNKLRGTLFELPSLRRIRRVEAIRDPGH